MAKILSVYNRLQAGDYENDNGGKRRVSRLTQFIHATLQLMFIINHFFQSFNQSIDEFWFKINGLHFNRSLQVINQVLKFLPKNFLQLLLKFFFTNHMSSIDTSQQCQTLKTESQSSYIRWIKHVHKKKKPNNNNAINHKTNTFHY